MPVVILEGLNGTGKTTVARKLSDELGIPVYRPFREDPDAHWAEAEKAKFEVLNIPVNTYVEDACAADALVQLNASAILDRSMPSAIVYAQVDNQEFKPTFAHLHWWQATLRRHREHVLLVQLVAPLGVIQERLGKHAPTAKRCNELDRAFGKVFQRITLSKMVINTGNLSLDNVVGRIANRVLDDADS